PDSFTLLFRRGKLTSSGTRLPSAVLLHLSHRCGHPTGADALPARGCGVGVGSHHQRVSHKQLTFPGHGTARVGLCNLLILSCTRGGSGWTSRRVSSQKGSQVSEKHQLPPSAFSHHRQMWEEWCLISLLVYWTTVDLKAAFRMSEDEEKVKLRRIEPAIQKFIKVAIPTDLERLRKHQINIEKHIPWSGLPFTPGGNKMHVYP
uniref:Syntaxin 17 n=1 Tax=Ficedula albicollis TaxID=59894 RepID=A0A803V0J0_FICAL